MTFEDAAVCPLKRGGLLGSEMKKISGRDAAVPRSNEARPLERACLLGSEEGQSGKSDAQGSEMKRASCREADFRVVKMKKDCLRGIPLGREVKKNSLGK
jgi:hypothetical protein